MISEERTRFEQAAITPASGSIACELRGCLKHVQVGRDRPLLPLFEAVINSFHAIGEVRKTGLSAGSVEIRLIRAPSLVPEEQGDLMGFEVSDDGIGFDHENYRSFCTAYSVRKERIGGKGAGRFSFLKVFKQAEIVSIFALEHSLFKRQFKFDVNFDQSAATLEPTRDGQRGSLVRLLGIDQSYVEVMPASATAVAEAVVEHCVPLLARSDAPSILVRDGSEVVALNEVFRSYHADNANEQEVTVRGTLVKVTVFRGKPGEHKLNLCAHGRQVRSEKLMKRLPGLPMQIGEPRYGIRCYVQSQALDEAVDMSRSHFNLPTADDEQTGLFKLPTLDDIRTAAAGVVEDACKADIDCANSEKVAEVRKFIEQQRPEYRLALRHLDELVRDLPWPISIQKLDQHVAEFDAGLRVRRRRETEKAVSKVRKGGPDIGQVVEELLQTVTDEEQAGLARHVANRRILINLFRASIEKIRAESKPGKKESDRYPLEAVLHNLIFPMRSMSTDVSEDHNHLWLIDERFSYHTFLASDKLLKSVEDFESESALRPDLFIYDAAWTFGEGRPSSLGSGL